MNPTVKKIIDLQVARQQLKTQTGSTANFHRANLKQKLQACSFAALQWRHIGETHYRSKRLFYQIAHCARKPQLRQTGLATAHHILRLSHHLCQPRPYYAVCQPPQWQGKHREARAERLHDNKPENRNLRLAIWGTDFHRTLACTLDRTLNELADGAKYYAGCTEHIQPQP